MVGCGDLGGRIAEALARRGYDVWTLSRGVSSLPWPALRGDVTQPTRLPALADQFSTLVYCLTPMSRDEPAYRQIYVDGLRNVIAASASSVLPRVCFVSSTAVYGDAYGDWLDENAECSPSGFNGRVLLEAEAVCLAAGPDNLVLRLGGIYGPGRESLIRSVREGRSVGDGERVWGNRIHVEDAAQAIAHLIGLDARGVCNVVDREPAPAGDVSRWIAQALNISAPVPDQPQPPPGGRRISSCRLANSGFSWRYPDYRSGYAALIAGARPSIVDDGSR